MKKLYKCSLCGQRITNKSLSFALQEDIEDWDYNLHKTKTIKAVQLFVTNV